jgi:hypothetical protein
MFRALPLIIVIDFPFAFVLQVQGVCDHKGNIIWYSGPHVGVISDIALWRRYTPPLDDGERLLGDKAYVGQREEIIAPFKKKRGAARLEGRRWHFNNVHAWYRATIEHCFAFVKRSVTLELSRRYLSI